MEQIRQAIQQMIRITDDDLAFFLKDSVVRTYKRQELLSLPMVVPNEIYFINKGILRVIITDTEGTEHTVHFALENQFIADYTGFMLQQPSMYALQAVTDLEVVTLPRSAIDWGYQSLDQGDRLGRLIAEYYFMYQDNRIKNSYARTPKERYDSINDVFPNIHNRVPQKLIASYLGITPVHLSRLKKTDYKKT